MRNFIATIAQVETMNITQAVAAFGMDIITKAYDKGRITFEGKFIVFIQ